MIYELVEANDPILTTKAERFDFSNPPTDPIQLARDLTETMIQHKGLGLAANQCGLPYSCFVMHSNPVLCCFNPRIVDQTTELIKMVEGCLTFPGLFLNINRPRTIKVRYTQPNGETITKEFDGMTARIYMHELDHLNGVIYTTHVTKLELDIAKRKSRKLMRKK
jgi:peptide deformylase